MEIAFHSRHRHIEHCGDLGRIHIFLIAKCDDEPGAVGQEIDQAAEPLVLDRKTQAAARAAAATVAIVDGAARLADMIERVVTA